MHITKTSLAKTVTLKTKTNREMKQPIITRVVLMTMTIVVVVTMILIMIMMSLEIAKKAARTKMMTELMTMTMMRTVVKTVKLNILIIIRGAMVTMVEKTLPATMAFLLKVAQFNPLYVQKKTKHLWSQMKLMSL